MDENKYIEMRELFTAYMDGRKLRKTEERYMVFDQVCVFSGHFDSDMLFDQVNKDKYLISRATLYNTLELLVDSGLIVPHQITLRKVQYEWKFLADTHQHLICTKCGSIREIRTQALKADLKKLKITRFTPEFYCLYVYGVCSKCKFKMRMNKK